MLRFYLKNESNLWQGIFGMVISGIDAGRWDWDLVTGFDGSPDAGKGLIRNYRQNQKT